MDYLHKVENMAMGLKNSSYAYAMANGSFGGMLIEFFSMRGGDLIFVFFAGILGALGGGFIKWALNYFLPERKKQDESDPDKK